MWHGFSVRFYRRDFSALLPLPGVRVAVRRFSWAALGGPEAAEFVLTGPSAALAQAAGWLRCPVEIADELGRLLWWGYAASVTVWPSPAAPPAGLSLDGLANACQVVYRSLTVFDEAEGAGRGRPAVTAWAEDAESVAEYGRKEARLALDAATGLAAAELGRATYLAQARYPQPVLSGRNGALPAAAPASQPCALIHCRGWWSTLGWLYYAQPRGLESWAPPALFSAARDPAATPLAPALLALGQGFAGTGISFNAEARRIDDLAGGPAALAAGDRVAVTGSLADNGVYTVAAVHRDPVRTYTAATLAFAGAAGRINDAARGLGFLERRDVIRVSGSAANNGCYTIQTVGGDGSYVEVTPALRDEAAGAAVTLTRGSWLRVEEAVAGEMPGAAVSVQVLAGRAAQAIRLAAGAGSWPCAAVALRAGRAGNPADALRLAVCADAAGRPGAELAVATLPAAQVPPGLSWVTFNLPVPVTLDETALRWLVVGRTGPAAAKDYYHLAVDEACPYGRGDFLLDAGPAGPAWAPRAPAAGLVFQALAAEPATSQLTTGLAAAPFITGCDVDPAAGSAALTCPYRAGEHRLREEMEELLHLAGTDGRRLLATVGPDRRVAIAAEPAAGATPYRLGPGGEVRGPHGEPLLGHEAVVGVWLAVAGSEWLAGAGATPLEPWPGAGAGAPPAAFVERCEIDNETGRRTLFARGQGWCETGAW